MMRPGTSAQRRAPDEAASRGQCRQRGAASRNSELSTGPSGIDSACVSTSGRHSDGEIRRIGPQIRGRGYRVDVKTMDEATWRRIYQAWLDYNLLCVRGQDLTIPDFISYSERFGPVTPHPSKSTRPRNTRDHDCSDQQRDADAS